jgi:hypothetical protein
MDLKLNLEGNLPSLGNKILSSEKFWEQNHSNLEPFVKNNQSAEALVEIEEAQINRQLIFG